VPPNGPPPGSLAPYCSVYGGPILIWSVGNGPADLVYHDWEAETADVVDSVETQIDGRRVQITIPASWVAEIRTLAPTDPRLSFSINAARDPIDGSFNYFPDANDSLLACGALICLRTRRCREARPSPAS
jgi:hypothetical protein